MSAFSIYMICRLDAIRAVVHAAAAAGLFIFLLGAAGYFCVNRVDCAPEEVKANEEREVTLASSGLVMFVIAAILAALIPTGRQALAIAERRPPAIETPANADAAE